METVIVRRKKLGKTSCNGIRDFLQSNHEIEVQVNRNDLGVAEADLYFRWGCTASLPNSEAIVVNSAKAIHWASDKKTSRKILADAGLAPKTWLSFQEWYDDSVIGNEEDYENDTVVIRPATHSQGKELYYCEGPNAIVQATWKLEEKGHTSYYISEYIPKVSEYRVFVCQGRVVWVANKTPSNPDDIAWNVAQGGKFENVKWTEWPMKVLQNAIDSMSYSGLDFGGVDIMVDSDGRAYCLEINSAPSQTSPYRQSCVAKAFAWIIKNGKEPIPLGTHGQYRRFIHPALDEGAILD